METPGAGKRAEQRAVLAWMRLARVFQQMTRAEAAEFACYDLSGAQFDVIAQLGRGEGITQQELANRLLVTKGNVSQLLDKMEERGLIARRPAGRANALSLTAEGKRLFATVVPAHEARIAARFSGLSPDERRRLLRLLRVLDRTLE
ncbi:MAG: MarR family transcriptional regulator [Thermomicrobia bacterium]|nr:MarR family transcriptional regulator [Thermomicrobia bacterium]MCA1722826.1 MarR family transcriptional regulator [Thermomicrobia bacterium]